MMMTGKLKIEPKIKYVIFLFVFLFPKFAASPFGANIIIVIIINIFITYYITANRNVNLMLYIK